MCFALQPMGFSSAGVPPAVLRASRPQNDEDHGKVIQAIKELSDIASDFAYGRGLPCRKSRIPVLNQPPKTLTLISPAIRLAAIFLASGLALEKLSFHAPAAG
jgi:hypothetical protein